LQNERNRIGKKAPKDVPFKKERNRLKSSVRKRQKFLSRPASVERAAKNKTRKEDD